MPPHELACSALAWNQCPVPRQCTTQLIRLEETIRMLETLVLAGGALYVSFRAYQAFKKSRVERPYRQHKQPDQHQQRSPTAKTYPPNAYNKTNDHSQDFAVTTVSVGLATTSALFYPPLQLVCIPLFLYLSLPALRKSYDALIKEQRVSLAVVDVVVPLFCLLNGYFVAPALSFWLAGYGRRRLESTRTQARQKLQQILGELPSVAIVLANETETHLPLAAVHRGDLVVVEAGYLIPVDGLIVEGGALINQSHLLRDTQPVTKTVGDVVFASALVVAGRVVIQAEKIGAQSAIAQMVQLLDAAAETLPDQLPGSTGAASMAAPVLGLGALAALLLDPVSALALMNSRLGYDVEKVAPLAWLTFLQQTAKAGILIKSPDVLPLLQQIDTIILNCPASAQADICLVIRNLRRHKINYVYVVAQEQLLPRRLAQLGADDTFVMDSTHELAAKITQLQNTGRSVCYVGDGIEDSAAMRQATLGIAMYSVTTPAGISSDTALADNQAQIIFIDSNLNCLPHLLHQARTFEEQLHTTFQLTYTPGLINLVSVLALQSGVLTSILLNNTGFMLALGQVSFPKFNDTLAELRERWAASGAFTSLPITNKQQAITND